MTHVVAAPDKFKGSLTAAEAAAALARGIAEVRPDLPVHQVPVADGGDGTVTAALAAGFQPVTSTARGPTGVPLAATIAIRGDVAVVEAAAAGGLARLPGGRLAPLTASSYGVGELLRTAVAAGARTIVLGVGGSASTDGGAGMLRALGARLLDRHGAELEPGGATLAELVSVDLTAVNLGAQVILASDVDNPLLGPTGAAAVFGPQKGADPAQVRLLDDALRIWSSHVDAELASAPSAGAAGGIGFAALAVLGASLRSGIDLLLDLIGFDKHLPGAELVITGEGSLDEQSLHGKAPIGVVHAAARAGVRTIAVAGRCQLDQATLTAAGITAAYALTDLEPDPVRSMADADRLLAQLAGRIAREWL
ncbi:MAG TPA: glycerate kinase [Pseudonocardiaceae bacterium]|nr:glycerate kinase [Pseudonocardiaceae bacterium]